MSKKPTDRERALMELAYANGRKELAREIQDAIGPALSVSPDWLNTLLQWPAKGLSIGYTGDFEVIDGRTESTHRVIGSVVIPRKEADELTGAFIEWMERKRR